MPEIMPEIKENKPVFINWEKSNGSIVITNDNPLNIAAAKKLGWKRIKPKKDKK